jgi:Ca2+/Na+ antiporter
MTCLVDLVRARIIACRLVASHEFGGAAPGNRDCSSTRRWAQIPCMRVLGFISVILAFATLYALADSELGAFAYYSLVAFTCTFLGYCWGSIERLREQIEALEHSASGRGDAERR